MFMRTAFKFLSRLVIDTVIATEREIPAGAPPPGYNPLVKIEE